MAGALYFQPAPSKLASEELAWRFEAALPRRYGDIGWTERGLVANGGWYPQPINADGTLPVFDWEVTVHLPPGRVGTLNAAAGSGTLTTRQRADRAALSVFRQGVISEPLEGLRLLEHRRAEPGLARWLREVWPEGAPGPLPERAGAPPLLIVEIAGYEQLATAGPGVVFLSDLAGRLSGGLRALHRPALQERAIEAALQDQGGWWAALEAAAMSPDGAARVEQVLGWFSWNPVIDALLTDGTLPFYADIFREPRLPPPGVTRIVPPLPAPAAAWAQAAGWISRPLPELPPEPQPADPRAIPAWLAQNLPPAVIDGWGQPWPPGPAQNYRLIRTPEGLRVVRDAPPDAPAEIVGIVVSGRDGEQATAWVAGPGPAALDLPSGPARPAPAHIDPDHLTVQSVTADDHWPARFRLVAYGWVSGISLTALDADAFGEVMIRRDGDTRHLGYLALSHDQQDQIALVPGYTYAFGPLMDRRYRPGRLGLSASASLLDPGFRPTGAGAVALGLSARISWDSRDEVHGQRIGVGVGVGTVPAPETGRAAPLTDAGWLSLAGSAIQYVPLHPRHVLALRLSGGLASGEVAHRLLPLGGAGGVRAVPESAAVGHGLVVGSLEYRWAALRHASLPLGFGWLSGLQICPGVDYGLLSGAVAAADAADPAAPAALAPGAAPSATGISLTLLPVADLLGASPNALAITLAWPIQSEEIAGDGVQVYIDFGLSF